MRSLRLFTQRPVVQTRQLFRNFSLFHCSTATRREKSHSSPFNQSLTSRFNPLPQQRQLHSNTVNDDPRMGSIISPDDGQVTSTPDCTVIAIVGFPYDEGCERNGGRIGAKDGPKVFRRFINVVGTINNPEFPEADFNKVKVIDSGDIEADLYTLEEAWEKLEEHVTGLVSRGIIPFVIGGSNDQSFSNACGLMNVTGGKINVTNIDAHFDVRPPKEGKEHSGSPFRQLLEHQSFAGHFVEFAAQGNQCSQVHTDYILNKGHEIIWLLQDIRNPNKQLQPPPSPQIDLVPRAPTGLATEWDRILEQAVQSDVPHFVSFDLDAVSGADAPGVSCPATVGLTAEEALYICHSSGKNKHVKLFDLSEFNPKIDEYRSGRLVANMFYFFVLGIASRTT